MNGDTYTHTYLRLEHQGPITTGKRLYADRYQGWHSRPPPGHELTQDQECVARLFMYCPEARGITMLEVPHLQNRSGGLLAKCQHCVAEENAARLSGSQSGE